MKEEAAAMANPFSSAQSDFRLNSEKKPSYAANINAREFYPSSRPFVPVPIPSSEQSSTAALSVTADNFIPQVSYFTPDNNFAQPNPSEDSTSFIP